MAQENSSTSSPIFGPRTLGGRIGELHLLPLRAGIHCPTRSWENLVSLDVVEFYTAESNGCVSA